eukprot:SAG11_NODE_2816_length_2943_cov_7.547117_2_plen_148_part_00
MCSTVESERAANIQTSRAPRHYQRNSRFVCSSSERVCRCGTYTHKCCVRSPQWAHQTHYRPGHPVQRPRDHGHKCEHKFHYVSSGSSKDAWYQAALLGNDHQEPQKVLYLRGPGARRQKRAAAIPRFQLPGARANFHPPFRPLLVLS